MSVEHFKILDFTCNFMCRICRPALSSKWDSVDENWTRFDKDHYYKDENRKLFFDAQNRYLNYVDLSELQEINIEEEHRKRPNRKTEFAIDDTIF